MIYTSSSITYILVGIELCFINMLQMFAGIQFWPIAHPLLFIIILGGLSMLFCHFMFWKNNRYLKYFQEYKKESLTKRVIWCTATQLFCIALVVIFFWTIKHLNDY